MIAKPHNPPSLHPPFSVYSLGMEVSGAERWLHLSGQVGVKKDGSVPSGAEATSKTRCGCSPNTSHALPERDS